MAFFKAIWSKISVHLHLILIGLSLGYFIFYSIYTLNTSFNSFLSSYHKLIEYFSSVFLIILTGGIYTAATKYLQFLGVFKDEFEKIILSKKFENKLEEKLTQITFSESFLLEQNNLEEIWQRVTLCKYKKQFPHLDPKLKEIVSNNFFSKNSISYYYKNFQIHYNFQLLENNIVKISESASYTVVRPNTDEFNWDYSLAIHEDAPDPKPEPKITVKQLEGTDYKTEEEETKTENAGYNIIRKVRKLKLSGHKEYYFDRSISFGQDLNKDRVFSFASDRIIDDLSFSINHCNKLKIIMEPVNGNKFYTNNPRNDREMAFINRGICMPGEKFKLFIFCNEV